MKNALIFAIVMALAAFAGYTLQSHLVGSDTGSTSELGIRPEFAMLDLEGKQHNISDWDGQVILLNFWATWCPPCRDEIPAFIKLQEQYGAAGFQVIGLAIDQLELVEGYSDSMGINYPILMGETEGLEITTQYGNRLNMLPYSVIIDRSGMIRYIKKGEIEKEEIEQLITPLLKEKNGDPA